MKKKGLMKSYICEKEFCTDKNNEKNCHYTGKYRGAAYSICNLRHKIPREIPIVFHNGSTYDYHFIIKHLATEFKGSFDCLGKNTEKYITISVPIKKEHDDDGKAVIYKLKFIDSYRFMSDSLSSLVDNLSEINNKKLTVEFIDNIRSMVTSQSRNIDNLPEINKKIEKSENKFIDSFRSMPSLLLSLVSDLSEIYKKKRKIRK